MPTGIALRDPREQLFDAAGRILLRDGPGALTSRAVTTEADCAKGVLHKHFTDFDAFLAELVTEHVARLRQEAAVLLGETGPAEAGPGDVADRLAAALPELFGPLTTALMQLVIARDELRRRLRQGRAGLPLATDVTGMIADHLAAERDRGRLAGDSDVTVLAPTLVGAASLLYTDREAGPPDAEAVRRMVRTVLAGAMPR